MDIDRARTNGTATGERHVGMTEAGQQRAEHQNTGAHGLHQFVRRNAITQRGGVDPDTQLFVDGDADPHATEQLVRGSDVLKVGDIAHCHLA